MDLGIAGRRAIVCASSKGLGKACAVALAAEGVELTINGRDAASLEATAREIRATSGASVTPVLADVTTDAGRAALLAACPQPDILINNAGGPPPGDFREWDRDAWLRALDANMLAPIALMKATVDGMASRAFGRVVNITTAGVKMPGTAGTLGLSVGARSGLTAFSVMLARTLAPNGVTINGLLPGRFDTARLRTTIAADAARNGMPEAEAFARASETVPAKRFGTPAEFGATCAFLCSAHAAYITGQSILMDGGVFPGIV
ncbi:MAG: SDR family oxidoreductase [Candidatus Eremiobacteraeota bacterium]|nr:SDR family oxidoreductase [Candidatus Eremiobacteraeota bacterium]